MDALAAKLGVSKGAIYQYFPSKEKLLVDVGTDLSERMIRDIEMMLKTDKAFFELAGEVLGPFYEILESWQSVIIFSILDEARLSDKLRELVEVFDRRVADLLVKYFERQKKAKRLREDVDSESLALGVILLQQGYMVHIAVGMPKSKARKAWIELLKATQTGIRR
jgi:AcrR family transcriptional regulator